MITSCPILAALIPPLSPLQDMTVALGANPPSKISSQPIIFFPLELTYFSILVIK